MDSSFRPHTVEERWRARWDDLAVGTPPAPSNRPTFTIALPPPNVTGVLHCGHAAGSTVQDILIRFHRMNGYDVEWTPGTDHAAIATQNVIERQLAREGTSKEQLGRDAFNERVEQWYKEFGGKILDQMRRLGFICDWSRTRFTLDEPYVRSIRMLFKHLFDTGKIYRGPRLVNWCPRCRSAISDEEVEWKEHEDALYQISYPVDGGGVLVVATVRPETMLGDAGIAVAPGDERYRAFVGKMATVPLAGQSIPVFEDAAVEKEFGTGVLKVTPAHDPTDYAIGERHGLEVHSVIAEDGTIDFPALPELHGMDAAEARPKIVEMLRAVGALVEVDPYVHSVGHCDRCGHVIEPLISSQWWVAMKDFIGPATAAVTSGSIAFHPKRYENGYLNWLENLRDWCISRQLWLGHAIPVSTCTNGHVFAWVDAPETCPTCGDTALTADPDVLDTWFSSAIWPFAIYGWPESSEDLARFYPTDVLVTAREIIPLWVARMIMMGEECMGKLPFHDVIITGTIQAPDGSRMSKSKGNVVDPLDMVEKYGADAVRAWASSVGTSGQDVRFDESKIASYQKFGNKLWQVTRFLLGRLAPEGVDELPYIEKPSILAPEDLWILDKCNEAIVTVTKGINEFHFLESIDSLYETIWHVFCDWYVEMVKSRIPMHWDGTTPLSQDEAAASWTATSVLHVLLRLLHPIMPFVTEECGQLFPQALPTLLDAAWPEVYPDTLAARTSIEEVARALEAITAVRAATQHGMLSLKGGATVYVERTSTAPISGDVVRIMSNLLRCQVVTGNTHPQSASNLQIVAGGLTCAVHVSVHQGQDLQRTQSTSARLAEKEKYRDRLRAQLRNDAFLAKAPREVVAKTEQTLAEVEHEIAALRGDRQPAEEHS